VAKHVGGLGSEGSIASTIRAAASNEGSLTAFLAGRLPFPHIVAPTARVLESHAPRGPGHDLDTPNPESVRKADRWAEKEAAQWIP
jgi:1-deoxy-D-xylulose 5-phosphate reductoisomerase